MQLIDLPVEIIEKILFYLNMKDLSSWFSISENYEEMVSNLFWKKLCERDGFSSRMSEYNSAKDKYWNYVNLKLCRYKFKKHCVESFPVCIYNSTIISCPNSYRPIQIWNIIGSELVFAHNLPPGKIIAYNRMLAIQNSQGVDIYEFDNGEKTYTFYKQFQCRFEDVIKIGKILMVIYLLKLKEFVIFQFSDNNQLAVPFPYDVHFLFSLYLDGSRLFIVITTSYGLYKIKMFDVLANSWVLDIICFHNICFSRNEPNIWVNPYYIVSTSMSFRGESRVIYDELKIYSSDGTLIKMLDIESSRNCYFHCCFSNDVIIVTTSPNRIAVIKENDTYEFILIDDQYINIISAPGKIMIATYKTYFQTYDWEYGEPRHLVELGLLSVDRILFNCRFYIAFSSIEHKMGILDFTGNKLCITQL